MLKKTLVAGLVAITAVSVALPEFSSIANAIPLAQPGTALEVAADNSNVQNVVARKWRRDNERWERNRDRDRRNYRHGRYRYRHNGWWYSSPWWLAAPLVAAPVIAGASRSNNHVEWCLNRYRSYKPSTDTFTGYDGLQHRCNSPY